MFNLFTNVEESYNLHIETTCKLNFLVCSAPRQTWTPIMFTWVASSNKLLAWILTGKGRVHSRGKTKSHAGCHKECGKISEQHLKDSKEASLVSPKARCPNHTAQGLLQRRGKKIKTKRRNWKGRKARVFSVPLGWFAAHFRSLSLVTLLGWHALEERDSQKAEVVNGFYKALPNLNKPT